MKSLYFKIILLASITIAGCSGDNSVGDPGPKPTEDVSKYMKELPTWDTFSPVLSPQPATAIGDTQQLETVVLDVEVVNEDGAVEIIPDVAYECQSQPFTLTDNPQQIVLYSPDVDVLWPGSLIQGKTHRQGLGSLRGLPIAERTPIQVSIPSLANNDNFRTVDTPSQAEVAQAIGSMVGAATSSGLSTPSSITFEMDAYHSESQFALEAGLSGNYLGFEGSATGSVNKNASKTTVSAQFYQKMFEVVIAPPQTPEAFFNKDFTADKLQAQVELGRIGPDNLPVYVANVVYGRMMMFSMTSTASESDIRATLSAAYDGIGGSVSGNLSVQQQAILQESEIRVTSIGGDADATIGIIRSGDWSEYFTESAPLSSAAPLSYTFKNLSDGSIATVSETTEYNITQCEARVATPGTFNFSDVQSLGLPIGTPATSIVADVNDDEIDDIIWNHVDGSENETVVAIGSSDGTFSLSSVFRHTGTPTTSWGLYDVLTGDFNNDGRDDLAWNQTSAINETFVAISNGDGSFTELPSWSRSENGWGSYTVLVADIDGRDGDDFVYNNAGQTNRTYVSFNKGDGTFTAEKSKYQDHPTAGFSSYTVRVADLNADGRDDLLWESLRQDGVRVYTALSVGDTEGAAFALRAGNVFNRSGDWRGYETLVGDIDGTGGDDLVWAGPTSDPTHAYRLIGQGNGEFAYTPAAPPHAHAGEGPFSNALLDVNGDGRMDLLLNHLGGYNRSFLGLGTETSEFDFSRVSQDHPAVDDWGQFKILTGDFNGDGREDVVYNSADVSNDVYVALAKE